VLENTNPVPDETTPANQPEEPTVDLAEEAGRAAASQPAASKEQKLRSLDDLDLDGAVRSQIESYVSKAINEAVSKHDERQTKKLKDDGYMNRAQVEELLMQKDAEYKRREGAKEAFLNVLGSEGLHPGSDGYQKVQQTYASALSEGKITPEILLTEAGIRTLVAMSGALPQANQAALPQSGLARSQRNPDGSVAFADGSLQLNAGRGEQDTLEDRVRRAVETSLDS
jgi:hypothetical protein